MNQLALPPSRNLPVVPELIAAAGDRASMRFMEFFAATIRNPHTRRAYSRAVSEFLSWCSDNGVPSIAAVHPLHVATWIELQTKKVSAPSVKQRLAAIRHLFDWLVTGQVVPVNPAASVRGPQHIVRHGKTPALEASEARVLLDSIKVVKTKILPDGSEIDTAEISLIGLRDRALIALMVFSLARVGAALAMTVDDVYTQNRRLWVRLREKAGKAHAMPCHHSLEEYLHAYIKVSIRAMRERNAGNHADKTSPRCSMGCRGWGESGGTYPFLFLRLTFGTTRRRLILLAGFSSRILPFNGHFAPDFRT